MSLSQIIILFSSVLSVLALCWIDWQLLVSMTSESTFGSAKITFGIALIVLVVIIFLGLHIYESVLEIFFERLLKAAKEMAARGLQSRAQASLIQAQLFNDRWLHRRDFQLAVLQELSENYRQTGDISSVTDVEYRIKVIQESDSVVPLEQRVALELIEDAPKEPKSKLVYAMAAMFVSCVLIASICQCPAPPGVTLWQDVLLRVIGGAGSAFVLAEAMHGRAHGGAGPTAYFDKQPYWFSIRSGLFLCLGITVLLRLDRTVETSGFWQLPVTWHGWYIVICGPLICALLTFVLASFRLTKSIR